jgi:hypothetical protein
MPGFETTLLAARPKFTAQVIGCQENEAIARLERGEHKHSEREMM